MKSGLPPARTLPRAAKRSTRVAMDVRAVQTSSGDMPANPDDKHFLVLMTADCIGDVVALHGAIGGVIPGFREYWVNDARELLKYLLGFGAYADRLLYPLPDMVLLADSGSMAVCHGVLRAARRHRLTDRIAFIVLADDWNGNDKQLARQLHARLCVEQPVDQALFRQQLLSLKELGSRAA